MGLVFKFIIVYITDQGQICHPPKKFESIFKTNHSIGEIYKLPSSKIKTFNSEIEKLLHKINK